MRPRKESRYSRPSAQMVCAVTVVCLAFVGTAFGSHGVEHVIYTFNGTSEGYGPNGGLVADSAGNLYGTNGESGASRVGTVFELSPPATPGGAWTNTVLYSFRKADDDGQNPWAGLIFDAKGNLYGTTLYSRSFSAGASIFELSPPASPGGAWTETILCMFPGLYDSSFSTLIFDDQGNLYGTTRSGIDGSGVVFELKPPLALGGDWREVDAYHFPRGSYLAGNLIMRKHMLYGSTEGGGTFNLGHVFQLVKAGGKWTENILHEFGADQIVADSLTFAGGDKLYGTSPQGGAPSAECGSYLCGVVFELSPPANPGDPWTEATIYDFQGGKDGANPSGPLVVDKAGNLYGIASRGGLRNEIDGGNGTVFELSPPTVEGGSWTETTLHDLRGVIDPFGPLLFLHGTFYGTGSYTDNVFTIVVTP